jgi:ribosomal protein L12E/L44/L45/RPP1/RPP2
MDNIELIDTVSKAMRTAWQLGQTYWRQADSDFTSDHRRSDETQRKYDMLVQETIAALSRSQDTLRCQCCGYLVTESEHRGCLRSAERSQDVARVAEDEPSEAQKHILAEQESLIHPATQVFFRAGLLACREYMARFVQHESPTIAASIRANWWPFLGQDFGPPRKLEWSEITVGEYGEEGFRAKNADEVSPTQEALPVALGFLQSIDPGYRRATIDMGMEQSIQRELAPQPPQAGASAQCKTCGGSRMVDDGEITGSGGIEFENGPIKCVKDCPDCATPAPAEPKGKWHDDYEAKGTIAHLDLDNHRLRRAMQKIMARLAELLDEDQFANIESIVKGVGVEPPEQRAATLSPQQIEEIMEQAQVFASAWSLVGGVFDHGDALETAEQEKANMRALLATIYGVPNE